MPARPKYITDVNPQTGEPLPKGTVGVDIASAWDPTPKQQEAARCRAPMVVHVGAIRTGKTAGGIMNYVEHGLMRYPHCNMLVLRRTFPELQSGAIEDFRNHCPAELYTYNGSEHVATFTNGSRLRFGHCASEKDVKQYLGTAAPFIIVDECSEFSKETWNYIFSRNTVNPECRPDVTQPCGGCGDPSRCGNPCMPVPQMLGCTNPFGSYWGSFYKPFFAKHDPKSLPKEARLHVHTERCRGCSQEGTWWVRDRCVYDPAKYGYVHSTIYDNPWALKNDPGLIDRLNMQTDEGMRRKLLFGDIDVDLGNYYGNWAADRHVVDLKKDPSAVIWQEWQPVWGGCDWAIGDHYCCWYFFTIAMVKVLVTTGEGESAVLREEYRKKTVCFKEYVQRGLTGQEFAALIAATLRRPCDERLPAVSTIYFSHEKFSRQVESHSPADIVSQDLQAVGLCGVQAATRDRIGRSTLLYRMLDDDDIVFLSDCSNIIESIPSLPRNEKVILDVLKPDGASLSDDCYDGLTYGLFGFFCSAPKPDDMVEEERQARMDPLMRHMRRWDLTMKEMRKFDTDDRPLWQKRLDKK